MARVDQNEWVGRVLGVALSEAAMSETSGGDPSQLLGIFQRAKDAVDAQINALAAQVRAEGDPDLDEVADRGLIGITGGTSVKLIKAFLELKTAPPDSRVRAVANVRTAAEAYRTAVFAHPMIDLIENNPWKVRVELRARLGAAIDTVIREAA